MRDRDHIYCDELDPDESLTSDTYQYMRPGGPWTKIRNHPMTVGEFKRKFGYQVRRQIRDEERCAVRPDDPGDAPAPVEEEEKGSEVDKMLDFFSTPAGQWSPK